MIKIASLPTIAGALLACGLSAAPAQAGPPNRTWVSGHGTDSGGCALVAPCRTFAFALTQTAAGGEIDVLDPAGYGPVTITKAISINGVGVAGIHAGSGNGVTINAGASDSVHLRGLTIEGLGSGANGILLNTGGNLEIENCVVRNFRGSGINIAPSTFSIFSVSNTIASNNFGGGIIVAASRGVLSKVKTNNNFAGGILIGGGSVTVVDSESSNNNTRSRGVGAGIIAGGPCTVMVRNFVASFNNAGLFVLSNAILRVAHSVVTDNDIGVNTLGGATTFSYGDNDIDGNGSDIRGVLTPLAKH
jgi:hypothetical protein